jgi:hypothetical protein
MKHYFSRTCILRPVAIGDDVWIGAETHILKGAAFTNLSEAYRWSARNPISDRSLSVRTLN